VLRHRLARPAQQLRRDRAVNATADVQNAMVLGFCRCLLVAGGAPWAIPCPGEDVVATPGPRRALWAVLAPGRAVAPPQWPKWVVAVVGVIAWHQDRGRRRVVFLVCVYRRARGRPHEPTPDLRLRTSARPRLTGFPARRRLAPPRTPRYRILRRRGPANPALRLGAGHGRRLPNLPTHPRALITENHQAARRRI
jgi:hypothetical protein